MVKNTLFQVKKFSYALAVMAAFFLLAVPQYALAEDWIDPGYSVDSFVDPGYGTEWVDPGYRSDEWIDPGYRPADESWVDPGYRYDDWIDPGYRSSDEWIDPGYRRDDWVDPGYRQADWVDPGYRTDARGRQSATPGCYWCNVRVSGVPSMGAYASGGSYGASYGGGYGGGYAPSYGGYGGGFYGGTAPMSVAGYPAYPSLPQPTVSSFANTSVTNVDNSIRNSFNNYNSGNVVIASLPRHLPTAAHNLPYTPYTQSQSVQQPYHVPLYAPPTHTTPTPYVSLTQIPYTGFDVPTPLIPLAAVTLSLSGLTFAGLRLGRSQRSLSPMRELATDVYRLWMLK